MLRARSFPNRCRHCSKWCFLLSFSLVRRGSLSVCSFVGDTIHDECLDVIKLNRWSTFSCCQSMSRIRVVRRSSLGSTMKTKLSVSSTRWCDLFCKQRKIFDSTQLCVDPLEWVHTYPAWNSGTLYVSNYLTSLGLDLPTNWSARLRCCVTSQSRTETIPHSIGPDSRRTSLATFISFTREMSLSILVLIFSCSRLLPVMSTYFRKKAVAFVFLHVQRRWITIQ